MGTNRTMIKKLDELSDMLHEMENDERYPKSFRDNVSAFLTDLNRHVGQQRRQINEYQ